MDVQQLDKYGRERIAKLADPSIPVHFRTAVYRIKKQATLLGFKDMEEVVIALKLLGCESDKRGAILRVRGSKGKRVPIWSRNNGIDVVQLWELLCNDGKPHPELKGHLTKGETT